MDSGKSSTARSSISSNASAAPGGVSSTGTDAENQSKLRTLLGILRKFMGVADIATVRFSLPAQLLEPIPNLEYWSYLDVPSTFAAMGDSDDDIGRFLGVLRFWFTKDLKYVKGKPCKPYNSTLGEFFRCSWDVKESLPPLTTESRPSSKAGQASTSDKPLRISFLTEQTSHHPPVSAFVIDCPEKGITARGYDSISAKFTGTSIKVTPGAHNLGIFVTLHNRGDETYRLTHPAAHLGGLLRGSLMIYVEDVCYVYCAKTKLKCILQYIGDGWLGKAKHRVEGVVYQCDNNEDGIERIKDVPSKAIKAKIEGSWVSQIYYTLPGSSKKHLLIDLDPLFPEPKTCPPEDLQLPNESRAFWSGVTEAMYEKDYGKATMLKQELEEKQRQKAATREKNNIQHTPRFFEDMHSRIGQPQLSEAGRKALDGLNKGDLQLDPYEVI